MIYNLQQEKKIGTLKIKQKAGREEGWSDKLKVQNTWQK